MSKSIFLKKNTTAVPRKIKPHESTKTNQQDPVSAHCFVSEAVSAARVLLVSFGNILTSFSPE